MQLPNKTNALVRFLKPVFPVSLRVRMRQFHQKRIFKKAIAGFRQHYCEIEKYPAIIDNLIYGWGNMGWSSFQDYTYAIINAAKQTNGPVLECGSGLSTILMGIIAEERGFDIYTLEHHELWAGHVKSHLAKLGIRKVNLCCSPLKEYKGFQWYNIASFSMPANFSLVICDGPPHDTKGGRYGLFPVMNKSFSDKTIILLDDYIREEEQSIVSKWEQEFDLDVTRCGDNDIYARIIVNK